MIAHKLYITYESVCPFLSPLLSQCAAVKTNLGAISDPAHNPRLNDKKYVLIIKLNLNYLQSRLLSSKKFIIQFLLTYHISL